jgi:hypothetical protein
VFYLEKWKTSIRVRKMSAFTFEESKPQKMYIEGKLTSGFSGRGLGEMGWEGESYGGHRPRSPSHPPMSTPISPASRM